MNNQVKLETGWIDDLINTVYWDIAHFCYSPCDKEYILQQVDRLKTKKNRECELIIGQDCLFFLKNAVQDVINYPEEDSPITKDRAWELNKELSDLRKGL